jgi:outer membrane biogenesis lipoprotein LolB
MRRRAFCVAAPALVLGACAAIPTGQRAPPSAQRPFSIEGRFSLQHKEDRWIGVIAWEFAPRLERVSLEIAGQTFATFERLDEDVKATLANGQVLEEKGWRALTSRAIGVALPLDAAPFWLRGDPKPDEPSQRVNAETFSQLDWSITVLARDESKRPARLRWQNPTTALTLVIDTWRSD